MEEPTDIGAQEIPSVMDDYAMEDHSAFCFLNLSPKPEVEDVMQKKKLYKIYNKIHLLSVAHVLHVLRHHLQRWSNDEWRVLIVQIELGQLERRDRGTGNQERDRPVHFAAKELLLGLVRHFFPRQLVLLPPEPTV